MVIFRKTNQNDRYNSIPNKSLYYTYLSLYFLFIIYIYNVI